MATTAKRKRSTALVRRPKARTLTAREERAIVAVISKALPQLMSVQSRAGWFPVLREANTGDFQRNIETSVDTILTNPTVFACQRLIATDIGKMGLGLVQMDENGIWTETENPAFSPFLRKPNHFQHRITFVESWVLSKLNHGNTYVLKQRDDRGVVVKGYVLDPLRVRPLVAPDSSVFYELKTDHLSGLPEQVIVPAREIMHDVYIAPFHPLVGMSPIYAAAAAAMQGLNILNNSSSFFANGSNPGGVITAPKSITQTNADAIKAAWDTGFSGDNYGKVAVLGDGMTYQPLAMNANDAQLIEQLKFTAEQICQCYGVPPFMVGVGPMPTYNNIEALNQQYYSQCLQSLIEKIEITLDFGLGLEQRINGTRYGTEFNVDDLLRMDSATRTKAASEAIKAGLSPNEVRKKYFSLGPKQGGEQPFLQEQNWPISLLAQREIPERPPTAPAGAPDEPIESDEDAVKNIAVAFRKALAA